jgi:hypothetical protein
MLCGSCKKPSNNSISCGQRSVSNFNTLAEKSKILHWMMRLHHEPLEACLSDQCLRTEHPFHISQKKIGPRHNRMGAEMNEGLSNILIWKQMGRMTDWMNMLLDISWQNSPTGMLFWICRRTMTSVASRARSLLFLDVCHVARCRCLWVKGLILTMMKRSSTICPLDSMFVSNFKSSGHFVSSPSSFYGWAERSTQPKKHHGRTLAWVWGWAVFFSQKNNRHPPHASTHTRIRTLF